ncbi:FAD:protein FMN transferase [Sulfurimonas sp. HSL3-7]|uniref:FAD:protein FMN transferase n=1 Tax=Sulfonitrofixus jiaomeiensis TaxID=3131938 RepID=UPI0031F96B7A
MRHAPLFLSLIFVLLLNASELLERTQVMMGTFATISLPQEKTKELQKSFEILRAVEASLSSYDANADIYKLNHDRVATLSSYSYEALLFSQRYYEKSNGYFDITVGSVTKGLYRFGEDERLADSGALKNARIGFQGLHFDTEQARLDEGTVIDLGGMGKGFGVDKAAAYLREQNVTRGTIALSGDIRCLDICKMGIQDPFGEGTLAEFTTKHPGTAVSTSGNYRRYVESRAHNHLIDPKKKRSQQEFASITLISLGKNSDIDAYATAASVMPVEEAIRFLKTLDVAYLLVTASGERHRSDNLERYVSHFTYLKQQ